MPGVFGGGSSIQLARVFGVRIGVDASWFVILFLIIWSLSGYYGDLFPGEGGKSFALAVISALLFFLSVLLHELGHAYEARRSGIGVLGIDLWMFGGVAKLDRDSRTAGEEFRVAIAGPVVTLLIGLACFAGAAAIAGTADASESILFDTGRGDETLAVLGYLTFINATLLAFNLIPAFPLDGGRVARAIAWWRTGDRARATRFAARLGRGFGFLMIGLGILLAIQGAFITGVWLGIVGWFLSQAARSAERQSAFAARIEGLSVADVMDPDPVAIPHELTLDRAEDEFFLRYRYPWFPVVDDGGRFVGLVIHGSIEDMPAAVRPSRTVGSVMAPAAGDSDLRVRSDDPLDTLLGLPGLTRLGAVMAVDGEGVLRGVVTADAVRRALATAGP